MAGTRQRAARLAAAAVLVAAVPAVARAADGGPCGGGVSPAGEWSTYGSDLSNSRNQPAESMIDASTARGLTAAFVYEAAGAINSTPIVDGGCVFVTAADGATAGQIVALDADSGEEVWAQRVPTGTAAFGGPVVGSPGLWGDLVIVPFNKKAAPFVAAFDRNSGQEMWRTTLDTQPSSGTNAGIVVHDGIVFAGFFGNAGPGTAERGGFVLLEAADGSQLAKTYTIPDFGTPADPADQGFEDGYAGAGIWATPAIDTDTGLAYVGTSNPHNPQKLHPRTNSILKIDLNRGSPTFGEILDFYQGMRDTIVPDAEKQPACDTAPGVTYVPPFSLTCLAIDLDFGASPNLIKTGDGRTLIGNLQKAGIYHVVDTADMTGLSQTHVGAPCLACNAASSAYVGGRAFVAAGPPGELVAIDVATGNPAWVGHLTGPTTYNAVSVANGLVWTVDSAGFLDAFDQVTGLQVVKRPLSRDTSAFMVAGSSSSGVAIARNSLYVAATRYVVGYRTEGT